MARNTTTEPARVHRLDGNKPAYDLMRERIRAQAVSRANSKVYFITDGRDTKIGRSVDVRNRVRNIQLAHGHKLTLIYACSEGADLVSRPHKPHSLSFCRFETAVHEAAEKSGIKRLCGEWFEGVLTEAEARALEHTARRQQGSAHFDHYEDYETSVISAELGIDG